MVKKYLKGIARIFLYLLAIFLLSFHLFAFTLNFSKVNSFFIEKIFAGKLTYDNISFRQNFVGIDINLNNFDYDGDIQVNGENLFLKVNLLNSLLSKEIFIEYLFFDKANIQVNPTNEKRNNIDFFVKEGKITRTKLGNSRAEILNIKNLRTNDRMFGFNFYESSISLNGPLKNISGLTGTAFFVEQNLKLLIDSKITLFDFEFYNQEKVLSNLKGLILLSFKDKFRILPSYLNSETTSSQQSFNIAFDNFLKFNIFTDGDSRDIYYWAPKNLSDNENFRQSNLFSHSVKTIFTFNSSKDTRSFNGKILIEDPKLDLLPNEIDLDNLTINLDSIKLDGLATGEIPFSYNKKIFIEHSLNNKNYRFSFLDWSRSPFSIEIDEEGNIQTINGSIKPKSGAEYYINFLDDQIFIDTELLKISFKYSKTFNIFNKNYLLQISDINSNLFTFDKAYPSNFIFDLDTFSISDLNTKFYVDKSKYIENNFQNLTFKKFSVETKEIEANVSESELEVFGNFFINGEDIKYTDSSFDFDALRVLSLIDLRTSFSSFLNLNFDKYQRDSFYIDKLGGQMKIEGNKSININSLELDFGPAKAEIKGKIKTDNQLYDTYDLKLDFTTKISQALPWYVAIFGGIPAAAGTAIVTGILDENLNEITKTSYKIKGNNNNLEVLNN